jgi:transposase-like protein
LESKSVKITKSSVSCKANFPSYEGVGKQFKSHERVKHKIHEYSRGDVTTNSAEGYFAILKRGINGVYHHVSKEHLPWYLSEFNFRFNSRKINDDERTVSAIAGFEGKRLTYLDSKS